MAMTSDEFARVIRLQGAAEQILESARALSATAQNANQLEAVGKTLSSILNEVRSALSRGSDEAEEFDRLIPDEAEIFWRNVEPRTAALVGWLAGVVAAESYQARLDAEARAYAEARVRAERQVGFSPTS